MLIILEVPPILREALSGRPLVPEKHFLHLNFRGNNKCDKDQTIIGQVSYKSATRDVSDFS